MIPNKLIQLLKNEGIDEAQFQGAQFLLLPEDILHRSETSELIETIDMDSFAKALREAGALVFTFMDAGIDLPAIERRSGDKWLGTVWIRDNAAIPLLISVLSGLIVLGVDRATKSETPPTKPIPKVHVELVLEGPGGQPKTISYEGDGKTLITILKALKDDDEFKD